MTDAARHELEDAAVRVSDELYELTKQLEKQRKRGRLWIGGLALLVVAMLITAIFAALDARVQDRKQSQRWCSLLNTITAPLPPGQATTPATERQRKTLAELNRLRDQFECA